MQPANPLARNTRGYILAQQGELEVAMREYAETRQADPDNFAAHYNLGDLASRLGQRDQAITHFRAALRLKPGSKEAKAGLDGLGEIPPD